MNAISKTESVALAQTSTLADTPREWLTFSLGDEEYGIDILRV